MEWTLQSGITWKGMRYDRIEDEVTASEEKSEKAHDGQSGTF
jgi:hypothetical protein